MVAALATAERGSQPAGLHPVRRVGVKLRGRDHHDQIHDAQRRKGIGDAVRDDEPCGDGTHHQRAGAIAADGDAGHQSAAFRKPLDQRGHRADVAHAHAQAGQHAVGEVQAVRLVTGGEHGGQHVADAVDEAGH